MRRTLFAIVATVAAWVGAQGVDFGAHRQPIPPTGNADLRWLDAALYDSGFLFNEEVREAYYDHCMRLVAPKLHFSEITWEWLGQHPAVFNAAFALGAAVTVLCFKLRSAGGRGGEDRDDRDNR